MIDFVGLAIEISLALAATALASMMGPIAMRGFIVVLMIMVALFAGLQTEWPSGAISNVENISYASVMAMQVVLIHRMGWRFAAVGVITTFLWVLFVFVHVWALSLIAPMSGSEAISVALTAIRPPPRIAAASLMAFLVASLMAVVATRATKGFPSFIRIMIGCVAAQAVDSLIFFPGAFGASAAVAEMTIAGFVVKSALSVPLAILLTLAGRQTWENQEGGV